MNNSSSRKSMTGLSQSVNATQFDIDGNINMEGFKLFNLGVGVNAADSITKSQLDTASGLFLKLDGSTTMTGDIECGANDVNSTGTLTGNNLAGTITTATQNSITGLGGITTLSMNSNKITDVADAVAGTDAVNKSQLDTASGLFLKLDGSTTMSGDIECGANNVNSTGTLTGTSLVGTITTGTQNSITGLGGITTLSMNSNKITSLADGVAGTDAINLSQLTTEAALYLPLAGGTMSGNVNMGTKTLTNIGTGSGGYTLPASGNLSRYVMRVSAADPTQLEFADPTDIEDNVWRFITGTGLFDTAVLRGTQTNTAVSIGKDTAALATSQLVRLYVFDATNAVITRNQSATIQTDLISTETFGQLKADNTTGAGSIATLFLTGRGGVKTQHIKAADGTTLNINTTTETSFNTESGISIGSGMGTTEPESSIVAAGSVKITAPTQHGVHMGEISSYAVVNLVETAGGAVHFNNPNDTENSGNFNAEILYTESNNVLNITNRATGETTNKTWFSGNGVVVDNVFQGYNWYAGEGADWAYTLRRSSGSWAAPAYQKLMIAFQTGIEYIVNTALGSHNFFFSGFGTENSGTPDLTFGKTTHVKASNGYIESSFHPMIYASINFNSAGTKIKGRNCSSTRISTGYYRIDFDAAASNANYVAIATATAGGRAAINAKTTTTCEVVTTTATSGGAVLADHGVNFIMVDH